MVTSRYDEQEIFLEIATGNPVRWEYASSFLYHATTDGERSVCGAVQGHETIFEEEPGSGVVDRSNDTMTCRRCQGLVRKLASSRNILPSESQ